MLTMDADDKPTVVTITSGDLKKLTKALKKGGRKTREGLDVPDGATPEPKTGSDAAYHRAAQYLDDKEVIKPAATNAQLLAFVERVENVERELAERSEDRKQIYAEARSCGFDVPTLKKIVALRKMEEDDRIAAEALLTTYMRAVGMGVQTDMGF